MARLLLAVPDFPRHVETDAVPRLQALESLIARGRPGAPAAEWRSWILGQAGADVSAPLPVARVVAGRDGHFAIATPVHLLAGLEHVHFDPAGLPSLNAEEWTRLCVGFNDVFSSDGLHLAREHGVGLLSLPRPVDALTRDPEPLAGREAGAWLPSGTEGAWLRRLMTEVQMWLYDHEINMEREARELCPVNGLWLWGLGGDAARAQRPPRAMLASRDPFLRRLWANDGGQVGGDPDDLETTLDTGADCVVASISLAGLAPTPGESLQRLEADWFAPLAAGMVSGRVGSAELLLGDASLVLRPADRFRFWRRVRPWQEVLA